MSSRQTGAVPPDAVRVWRGFKMSAMELKEFHELHAKVFIPAAVKLQVAFGLESYVPTVLAGLPGKPDSVPDETAIVFYESQSTYTNSFNKLAMRAYALLHRPVYDFQVRKSSSGFPVAFDGSLKVNTPVYLFDKPAVWMHHAARHLAAVRPPETTLKKFLERISKILTDIKNDVKLDGAIACAGNDYLVYWELAGKNGSSGIPMLKEALTDWNRDFDAEPAHLQHGLWDDWKGMDIKAGSSFNMQFDRRRRAAFAKSIATRKMAGLDAYINMI